MAIRGAVQAKANTPMAIAEATRQLMSELAEHNEGLLERSVAMWITCTPDLTAAFPAQTIRQEKIAPGCALMCAQEMDVPGALERVIRVMVLIVATRTGHVHDMYLGETSTLIEEEPP